MTTRYELTDDNGRQLTAFALEKVREAKVVLVGPCAHRLLLQVDHDNSYSITVDTEAPHYEWLLELIDTVWQYGDFFDAADRHHNEWIDMHKYRRQRREGPLSKLIRREVTLPTNSSTTTFQLYEPEDPAKRQKTAQRTVAEDVMDDAVKARSEKVSRRKILEKATHLKNLVLATRTSRNEILKYVWDDLIGQSFPETDARHLVHNVNTRKFNDAAKGMLFYGPPGLGKDVLANIMFHQMNDATVFDIPHDFGARQPEIWGHLIDIAYDHSPAIIYFNECDGVFKGNTNPQAIKRAWNAGIETGGYVLMLGSTNGVMKIDSAIVNRFGDPYKFDPLTPEQRCILIKRKILDSYDEKDEAKADLETADDAEWMELAALIPVDKNPRWLVIDFIKKVKSTYNYKVDEGNRTTLISLQDFMDRLRILPAPSTSDATLSTDAQKLVIHWLQKTCEVEYEAIIGTKDLARELINAGVNNGATEGLHNATTLELMGIKNFTAVLDTANKIALSSEFVLNLETCLTKAFPETYGGVYGPSEVEGGQMVSIYELEPPRREREGHSADEQMVTIAFGQKRVPGQNDRVRGYISNLTIKTRYCENCKVDFKGRDLCPKCGTFVPRPGTGADVSRY